MNNLTPKKNIGESELFDNDEFKINEADSDRTSDAPKAEGPMDEQLLRIEALKIATKISKLFDNVQPSDLIEMSDKVYNFIQHQNNSGEYDENFGIGEEEEAAPAETEKENEDAAETEDFEINDEDEKKEEPEKEEEKPEEKEEKEETSEDSEVNPEDIFDFTV